MPHNPTPPAVPALALKLEMFTAMTLTAWGLWVMLPVDSFSVSPAWRYLAEVAPEPITGTIIAITGLVAVYALLIGEEKQRLWGMCMVTFWWIVLGLSSATVNVFSTGTVIYLAMALGTLWTVPDALRRHRMRNKQIRRTSVRIPRR